MLSQGLDLHGLEQLSTSGESRSDPIVLRHVENTTRATWARLEIGRETVCTRFDEMEEVAMKNRPKNAWRRFACEILIPGARSSHQDTSHVQSIQVPAGFTQTLLLIYMETTNPLLPLASAQQSDSRPPCTLPYRYHRRQY